MSDAKQPEAKKRVLSDVVLELAKKITDQAEVDKASGVITTKSKVYEDNLPDGLTIETVKNVKTYDANFIAAGAYAVGQLGVNLMASNKKVDTVTAQLDMGGKDNVVYTVPRTKEIPNRFGDPALGEKTIKYGAISAVYNTRAGKNGGQLETARKLIAAMGAEKLSK